MKKTFFALVLISLLGCNENGAGTGHADGAPYTPQRMICKNQKDSFDCTRLACQNAGGQFDEANKSCKCPDLQIFTAQTGGACLMGEKKENGSVVYLNLAQASNFYLNDKASGSRLSEEEITQALRGFSAPIYPALTTMMVFRDGKDFLKVQAGLEGTLTETLTFGMPNTYLSGVNINGGIYNAVVDRSLMFQILPSHRRIELSNNEQTPVLEEALQKAQKSFNPSSVYSFSNLGCAEICVAKEVLADDVALRVTRTRVYSNGNPMNDQLSIYNKNQHVIDVSAVLFGNQVSHYIQRENGQYNLYSNEGLKLSTLADHGELEKGMRQQNGGPTGKPVIIFEDGLNADVDKVVLRGPYRESFYGWFGPNDNKPFLYGKAMSEWGEDYSSDSAHAYEVARLASMNFQRAIIPFSSAALINGDFNTKLSILPKGTLVASISVAFPYERNECLKSPVAKAILQSKDQILWTIGAGNSGKEMQTGTLVSCPQVLRAANTLIVAATSGSKDHIAYSSTFGEQMVDIAENGCRFDAPNCSDPQSATSYAAPRVARGLANLANAHSKFLPEEVRTAVLLSVRVPYNDKWVSASNDFLPVRSGGVVDFPAANDLLTYLEDRGVTSFSALSSVDVVEALVRIKASQYPNWRTSTIENLVQDQIVRLKNNYKEIL